MRLVPSGKSLTSGYDVLKRSQRDYPITEQSVRKPNYLEENTVLKRNQNPRNTMYSQSPLNITKYTSSRDQYKQAA